MATAKKYISKNGEVTYYLRAYHGYDRNGKQIEHRRTWKPNPGMSKKAIQKELERQKILFEEEVKKDMCFDSNTTFREYSEVWLMHMKSELAPKTYERYCSLLQNINIAIGHKKLVELQSQHLQSFYCNLREDGVNENGMHATSKDSLKTAIKNSGLSKEEIAKAANLSATTVRKACHTDEHISKESAQAISKILNQPVNKLFDIHESQNCYSEKTILHYHRLISVILRQATMDQLIPRNIASKEYMRAPRVSRKEATFLDDKQIAIVINALNNEPIKWRTAVSLLIYSGMRRGELMGLEWSDIDFENQIIHIRRTSQYVSKLGIITKDTKNASSERTIKLPKGAFKILKEYQHYCQSVKKEIGDYWHDKITITYGNGKTEVIYNDRVFTTDNGEPMNPDSVTDWVHKFVVKNNLPKFSPHSLRHTNATLLIAHGMNIPTVSKRLGHSNVSTTTRIYTHAIQSADEKASEILSTKLDPLYQV